MKRGLFIILLLGLCACSGHDAGGTGAPGSGKEARSNTAGLSSHVVPRPAQCAKGDHPETALQGQVPAALRASGFNGFNCNLKLAGQQAGEGGGWSAASFKDRAGHVCAYYASAFPKDIVTGEPVERLRPGVQVIDITQPTRPMRVGSLTSKAMMDPWESLRVNWKRQLLVGGAGANAVGGPEIDLYDLSEDCRFPKLLASKAVGTGKDGGIAPTVRPIGHEGNFAPDGLTYYIGDTVNGTYNAVDISDPTHPRMIAQFDMKAAPLARESSKSSVGGRVPGLAAVKMGTSHGLSIRDDGNRAYFVSAGYSTPADAANPNFKSANGFYVVDTSEVQARKPDAQMKLVSVTRISDGTMAQHMIAATIAGKPYLIHVDEGGAIVSSDMAGPPEYLSDLTAACHANLPLFPSAHIFDISDERKPKEVSQLLLQTHDPANCQSVLPDLSGLSFFTYGSHYCSVDNRQNATALACSYFNSGVRVFDIRNPSQPKEIAYYNPPGSRTRQPGSNHAMLAWHNGAPDWCASRLDFDFERKTLVTACQDNGLLVLQFENGVWPMPESTPATEQGN